MNVLEVRRVWIWIQPNIVDNSTQAGRRTSEVVL
jgi:hypothetical protein